MEGVKSDAWRRDMVVVDDGFNESQHNFETDPTWHTSYTLPLLPPVIKIKHSLGPTTPTLTIPIPSLLPVPVRSSLLLSPSYSLLFLHHSSYLSKHQNKHRTSCTKVKQPSFYCSISQMGAPVCSFCFSLWKFKRILSEEQYGKQN
ncbi:hypothetical protein VNO78_21927 [Psophocarpus tetragonolobus]|uniref:Uncharacterized protein n=1 Tax=Psophocarpus tetragonolobus TaxID=3891 RepID=A0AAN9SDH1_PSOTE